ncbi:MAG: HAD-IC family P-type ATPase, partial [Myxococcota bacterium]
MSQVEQTQQRRARIVERADRFAGVFVLIVMSLAVLALAVGAYEGTWSEGMERAIALLIISCPCALGLATPLAITVALGRAAAGGLLVKGGDVLEHLTGPATFVFDKTGTLTRGQLELTDWFGNSELRSLVAGIEQHSTHGVARALHAASNAPLRVPPESVRSCIGGGVEAEIERKLYRIGSVGFIERAREHIPPWVRHSVSTLVKNAKSPVLVSVDGTVEAVVGLGDRIRPDAL